MSTKRTIKLLAIGQALIIALALLSTRAPQPAAAQTAATRIMPLGDSITGSPGCWRALLWNRLQNSGYTNIDFVGTLGPQGCGVAHDGDNEGHGGYLATNVASQNLLPGWLAATKPDIVLMHFATNDVWSNRSPATILAAFSTLVDQMRASNPNMKILVAQIIPVNPSTCPECAQRTIDFNAAIPGWASGKSTAQSPIIVVDQWTGFNTATDTYDGVHPNAAGDQKMSDKWYPALAALLSGTPVPTATRTPTRTPTSVLPSATPTRTPTSVLPSATPTRTPTGVVPTSTPTRTPTGVVPSATPTRTPSSTGCQVSYTVNQWGTGFTAEVKITSSVAISGWTLAWVFPGNQQISNMWNASYTQSGASVTARNMSYNGSIPAGGSQSFGFQASYSGTNAKPSSFTLNGTPCSSS